MNEFVRGQLSEKKKIKDLFITVIKSIGLNKDNGERKVMSSLV